MSPRKETQKSAKSTTATSKKSKGFTDEERAAMKERAHAAEYQPLITVRKACTSDLDMLFTLEGA